ncbi:MAG TPA: hypothetical protein VKV95_24235 [Terriglobia bacterium]|nr:hypothetical protein [Terriglobia bacterium]
MELKISAGTGSCGKPQALVTYVGGTLPLTASQINYIYLDPSAGCVPEFNTKGFAFGQVPIAIAYCSGSAITSVTDARPWSTPQPIGTNYRGQAVTEYKDGMRWADQFPGVTPTIQQSAAVKDIGTVPGIVFTTPALGAGAVPSLPNNVGLLDFRQTQDILTGSNVGMVRTPIMGITQNLGELTSVPLTGTVTVAPNSTDVTGVGTHFVTELSGFGASLKANSDLTKCWAAIKSVSDDTHASLTGGYPCAGGSGPASHFMTQLGLTITNLATAGTPNTPAGGETVGLSVFSSRIGGRRPLFGANINTSFLTVPDLNVITDSTTASALEIDFSNGSSSDITFPWIPLNSALHIVSAGSKKVGSAISIYRSANNVNEFGAGIWINQAWDTSNSKGAGVRLDGSQNHVLLVPLADNTNPEILGKNSQETSTAWQIQANGGAFFGVNGGVGNNAVGFGTGTPNSNSRVHVYVSSSSLQIPLRIENDNVSSGVAAIGFGVASSARRETSSFKAGIGLVRTGANGQGSLYLMNHTGNDANNFTSADYVLISRGGGDNNMGQLELYAQGTNQNVYLSPSGSGVVQSTTNFKSADYTITTPGTTVAAGTCASGGTVAISGLLTTSAIFWSTQGALPASWQTGINVMTDVSTAGTAKIWLCNGTAANIILSALTINIKPIL